MKGKINELRKEKPTSVNTTIGGNQVKVPLLPRTNNKAIVVSPAIKQVPNFLSSDVEFIFSFVELDS